MPKTKKSSSGSGLRKKHGPKRKMFHYYSKALRIDFGKLGMLKKDVDFEAKAQSEAAKDPRKINK